MWRSPLCAMADEPATSDRDEHEREPREGEAEHVPERAGQLEPRRDVSRSTAPDTDVRRATAARGHHSSAGSAVRSGRSAARVGAAPEQHRGRRGRRACGRPAGSARAPSPPRRVSAAQPGVVDAVRPQQVDAKRSSARRPGRSSAPRRSASSTRVSMIAPSASSPTIGRERLRAAQARSRPRSSGAAGRAGGVRGRPPPPMAESMTLAGRAPRPGTRTRQRDVSLQPAQRARHSSDRPRAAPGAGPRPARAARRGAARRGHPRARAGAATPARRGHAAASARSSGVSRSRPGVAAGQLPDRARRRAPPASAAARCRRAAAAGRAGRRRADTAHMSEE